MFDTSRTTSLIGSKINTFTSAHLVIAGCGGVGGTVIEILARAGIGAFTLIDHDILESSNINRQILALQSTLGQSKIMVAKDRIKQINPNAFVQIYPECLTDHSDFEKLIPLGTTYVLDCIDDIPAKGALIAYCLRHHIPVISAMGAGRRLDSRQVTVLDFWKVKGCPLARHLRGYLRQQDMTDSFPCVASLELPCACQGDFVGSFVPVVFTFGVQMASFVLSHIIKN